MDRGLHNTFDVVRVAAASSQNTEQGLTFSLSMFLIVSLSKILARVKQERNERSLNKLVKENAIYIYTLIFKGQV